ncbi:glycine cleavage system aminomethyltransferase GcvT [Leptolyngbya sp. 7M]|uniref:glycine cleavage system aminomethyltransferase GcvT n=1 Tax=Leptolyngbya sp. 7M TaxID=2812896 RepID=UPI001B8B98EF|nr:glycine cleavage system aminomethyltransferase GcvT [Leptolyngbya sp. 7M]QYO63475.1 glycine cleavage system aminomethyltransferase GcvT [Leptolyngbya sp. 7M]
MGLRTPLYQWHIDNGGQMVDFAGWDMPIRYAGIIEEHNQVRTSGGLFDVSHMGRVKVTGRHARRFLERLCTRRISDMQDRQCRYSLVCNEQGGVKDDIIVYRFEEDEYLLVVNASNRQKLLPHFEAVRSGAICPAGAAAEDLAVKIEDQTEKTAMVAVQGPKVIELISKFSSEIPTLKKYRFAVKNLMIMKLIVSRTGYTGEDGVEVILPANMVTMAMGLLLRDVNMKAEAALIKPAGLGARDTLRMEAGMPLYGHELGEDINALACGVDFAITLDKDTQDRGEPFVGQQALRATAAAGGPARKLVGIRCEGKRTPRQGMAVKIGDRDAGVVTSGCLGPTVGCPIAMAFVDRDHAKPGVAVQIDTTRGLIEGQIAALPFYKAAK